MKPTYLSSCVYLCSIVFLFISCSFENEFPSNDSSSDYNSEPEFIVGNFEDEEESAKFIDPVPCEDCTHVVDSWTTDGFELSIKPGDTICLDGNVVYENLVFTNIQGTPDKPIIIKNCDGKVAFVNATKGAFGVKFQHSHDFKLIGNGGGSEYGIKITTHNGFFLSLRTFSTDFEIANIEIAGESTNRSGFSGIGIKTSPYEDCDLFTDPTRSAWEMKNIVVRDNYIHDIGGEGIYIGHGFYKGRVEPKCTSMTYSHNIRNVRIYNNIIKNVGFDGIQIKNCNENVAVFKNLIDGYAKNDQTGTQDEGLYIGDGTTGKFYNNIIKDGGTGIMVHGMGDLDIYNNIVIGAKDYAFFASGGKYVSRFPNGYFNVFNNTFHSTGSNAFAFFGEDGGEKKLKNNIFIAPNASEYARKGVALDSSNNVFKRDISYFKFVNFAEDNLRLSKDSPVIDSGKDLSSLHAFKDMDGVVRPQGDSFDIGAYEYRLP